MKNNTIHISDSNRTTYKLWHPGYLADPYIIRKKVTPFCQKEIGRVILFTIFGSVVILGGPPILSQNKGGLPPWVKRHLV